MAAVGLEGRRVADRSCPPSMPAFLEQGARELSSFCLAWVDGGDTKAGGGGPAGAMPSSGPLGKTESILVPGRGLRAAPGYKQVSG